MASRDGLALEGDPGAVVLLWPLDEPNAGHVVGALERERAGRDHEFRGYYRYQGTDRHQSPGTAHDYRPLAMEIPYPSSANTLMNSRRPSHMHTP